MYNVKQLISALNWNELKMKKKKKENKKGST